MGFRWDAISDRENEWDDEAIYGGPPIPLVDDDEAGLPEPVGEIDWGTIWEESRQWVTAVVLLAVWWAVMTVVLS